MIFSITWKVVGFGMILFVAGIQSIDKEIIEAALIDGASYWQRVRRIILPLSYRTILLATLISVIGSLLAVDQFIIMTGGNPRGQTFSSVYWIYQNSFVFFKLGYGSALSVILMLIIFGFAATQIILTRRRTEHEQYFHRAHGCRGRRPRTRGAARGWPRPRRRAGRSKVLAT